MGFYDDTPELMDTNVEGGYYTGGSDAQAPMSESTTRLSLVWWEWAIIAVEVLLVVYTVLVLLGIAPLF